jgi:hypothetical protein
MLDSDLRRREGRGRVLWGRVVREWSTTSGRGPTHGEPCAAGIKPPLPHRTAAAA